MLIPVYTRLLYVSAAAAVIAPAAVAEADAAVAAAAVIAATVADGEDEDQDDEEPKAVVVATEHSLPLLRALRIPSRPRTAGFSGAVCFGGTVGVNPYPSAPSYARRVTAVTHSGRLHVRPQT